MNAKTRGIIISATLLLVSCDGPTRTDVSFTTDPSMTATVDTQRQSVEDKVHNAIECAMVSDVQIARSEIVHNNVGSSVKSENGKKFRLLAQQMKGRMAVYYEGLTQTYAINENLLQLYRNSIEIELLGIINEFEKDPGQASRKILEKRLQAMFDRSCKYILTSENIRNVQIMGAPRQSLR